MMSLTYFCATGSPHVELRRDGLTVVFLTLVRWTMLPVCATRVLVPVCEPS